MYHHLWSSLAKNQSDMNTSLKEIGLKNMLKTTHMKCNDLNLECVQFHKTYDFISSRNKWHENICRVID